MKPQIIETPSGERLVVLPFAEYEALLRAAEGDEDAEDAADASLAAERLAEIRDGADAPMSKADSGARLVRDGYLRAVRKQLGLTQAEVAEAAGIAQGFLSDIESGRRNASRETLQKIGKALGMPDDQF